ncbi:hypothetical protein [Listeria booriae]|uniref:DUF2712 domain-containing protein n=1 Tax=Listeria booriae TaxID=1552123 RepID=A0A7X0ZR26_9LIST|nr:hypothetical protein [Listeria booriae]MBC1566815.1 hypothetical protein [Listeria booriae]MBC2305501.1 hypothetical protein [Listeria booriae]
MKRNIISVIVFFLVLGVPTSVLAVSRNTTYNMYGGIYSQAFTMNKGKYARVKISPKSYPSYAKNLNVQLEKKNWWGYSNVSSYSAVSAKSGGYSTYKKAPEENFYRFYIWNPITPETTYKYKGDLVVYYNIN